MPYAPLTHAIVRSFVHSFVCQTPKASGWVQVCYCETDIHPKALAATTGTTGTGAPAAAAAAVAAAAAGPSGAAAAASAATSKDAYDVKSKAVSPKRSTVFSFGRSTSTGGAAAAAAATSTSPRGGAVGTSPPSSPTHVQAHMARVEESYWSYLETQDAPFSFKLVSPSNN